MFNYRGFLAAAMSLPASDVFNRFDIDLDAGEDPVFHGGELITGSLRINLKKQITIKVIRIQFKGRACWLGDAAKDAEIEKVYFDKDFVLLERPPGRPEPGHFPWVANFTYSLPFQCPLPKGCPTSYEGPQGFIRYFARATLITDEVDATQYIVKKGISIVASPELHELLPPHSEPIEVEETATYGTCCCKGKIIGRIELPKTAYAPGERVTGSFTINGKHPKQLLEQVEVRLVDKVTRAEPDTEHKSKSKAHHMDTRTILMRKLEVDDVSPVKGSVSVSNIHFLTIPPVVPSTVKPTAPSPVMTPEIKLDPDNQVSKLLESPSTGTLKQRKKPFICINYILQISAAGNKLLIEVPITIHPVPFYESGIDFRPFPVAVQNFHEADETDKKPLNAPFKFQPQYPVYTHAPPTAVKITEEPEHEMVVTSNGDVELKRSVEISDLPNGDRIILTREEMVIVHNEERPASPDSLKHSIVKKQLDNSLAPEVSPSEAPEREEEAREEGHDEAKEPSPIPVVEITPSDEAPVEDETSVVIQEGEVEDGISKPHIHSESDENGHVITTEDYEDGDTKTHKTIETYEYTDENGVRVEVQKTTEATVVHHEEQSAH